MLQCDLSHLEPPESYYIKVGKLGSSAEEAGKNNVSFLSYFLLGDLEKCLEILIASNRIPEAAFFARLLDHLPLQIIIPSFQDVFALGDIKGCCTVEGSAGKGQ